MLKLISIIFMSAISLQAFAEGSYSGPIKTVGLPVTLAKHTGTIRPITDFCYDDETDKLVGLVPVYKSYPVYMGRVITDENEIRRLIWKDNVGSTTVKVNEKVIEFPRVFSYETIVCSRDDDGRSEDWKKRNCDTVIATGEYQLHGSVEVRQYFKDNSSMYRVIDSYDYTVKHCQN